MEFFGTIKVNGKTLGRILTNRSLTDQEILWCLGYDINDQEDCKKGYEEGIEGFGYEDGEYFFDPESEITVEYDD